MTRQGEGNVVAQAELLVWFKAMDRGKDDVKILVVRL